MNNTLINLINMGLPQLKQWLETLDQPPYRAEQMIQWIYQRGVTNFNEMTNLSQLFRHYLAKHATLDYPKIVKSHLSIDGTRKWLFKLHDGHLIESVYIPEKSRGTLCISSQVGCPLACTFCATGQLGFTRNLNLFEIMGQVYVLVRELCQDDVKAHKNVTNIVFMGMGEPLLNLPVIVDAVHLLMSDFTYGFSKYRLTISTIGFIDLLLQLKKSTACALAISLHAPTDALRHQLMPATKKYSLKQLMDVCKTYYSKSSKRKLTMEYLLLQGINDQPSHAQALIRLLKHVPCKVNLIRLNPIEKSRYRPSLETAVKQFQHILVNAGINTRLRKSRGSDIEAACGQLAGEKYIS